MLGHLLTRLGCDRLMNEKWPKYIGSLMHSKYDTEAVILQNEAAPVEIEWKDSLNKG